MKNYLLATLAAATLSVSFTAFADYDYHREYHRAPPKIAVCEGRHEGARVALRGPHGEWFRGVCTRMGHHLEMAPLRHGRDYDRR